MGVDTILSRDFYKRSTQQVARELLGARLVRKINGEILSGIIVETECYVSTDPACHAFRGKTQRNQSLFGQVGHAYVYFTYGSHFCLNAVARDESVAAGGVLVRAIMPLSGIETMQLRRSKALLKNLTNGPGKLTQALSISRDLDGYDLTKDGELTIEKMISLPDCAVEKTPRIGISQATDILWRFVVSNEELMKNTGELKK